jgi:hypothetical protein
MLRIAVLSTLMFAAPAFALDCSTDNAIGVQRCSLNRGKLPTEPKPKTAMPWGNIPSPKTKVLGPLMAPPPPAVEELPAAEIEEADANETPQPRTRPPRERERLGPPGRDYRH